MAIACCNKTSTNAQWSQHLSNFVKENCLTSSSNNKPKLHFIWNFETLSIILILCISNILTYILVLWHQSFEFKLAHLEYWRTLLSERPKVLRSDMICQNPNQIVYNAHLLLYLEPRTTRRRIIQSHPFLPILSGIPDTIMISSSMVCGLYTCRSHQSVEHFVFNYESPDISECASQAPRGKDW